MAQVQPTIAETPGPGLAFVSVSQNTNCRSGPRLDYTLLTTINIGQQVEVLKTFSDEYVLVKNPNGAGDCWLFLRYADTTDFTAVNLEVATQPPTPTPTNTPNPTDEPAPSYDWDGNWVMKLVGGGEQTAYISVSGSHVAGTVSFELVPSTFSGTVSADGQYVTGTLTTGSESSSFQLMIKSANLNQFVGSLEYKASYGEWCGWRSGSSRPNPCKWP